MQRTTIPTAQNLFLYSEQFDNAVWAVSGNAAATANTTTNPIDGAQTADTITASAGGTFHDTGYSNGGAYRTLVAPGTGPYTFSIHVKRNNNDWIALMVPSNVSSTNAVYFNLATGAWGSTGANATTLGVTRNIEKDFGNGWYRLSVTIPTIPAYSGATAGFGVFIANANNGNNFSAAGTEAVYVFGAQLTASTRAGAYTVTTSSNVNTGGIRNVISNRTAVSNRATISFITRKNISDFAGISGAVFNLSPLSGINKDGSNNLISWTDSASNVQFFPTSTNPTYTASGINTMPAISFNGTNNVMIGDCSPTITGVKNWTFYLVVKPTVVTGSRVICSVGGNNGGYGASINLGVTGKREAEYKGVGFPDAGNATTNAEIWCISRDNQATAITSFSVNGSAQTVGTPNTSVNAFSSSRIALGANFTAGFYNGLIGHILLYATEHDATTKTTIINALNSLYGIF